MRFHEQTSENAVIRKSIYAERAGVVTDWERKRYFEKI